MKRLYLETNYIVGQAFSQDSVAATILTEAANVCAEVCIPSVCAQEALATVELRTKRANDFSRTLQEKMRELRSDQSSTAKRILALLNQALIENGRLANERQVRLAAVFQSLAGVRFINVDTHTTNQAVSAPLIVDGATDNLILHAVIAHAIQAPLADMAFFTRNTSDFNESAVLARLASAGVTMIFGAAHAVAWLNRP